MPRIEDRGRIRYLFRGLAAKSISPKLYFEAENKLQTTLTCFLCASFLDWEILSFAGIMCSAILLPETPQPSISIYSS
jgi:hypothetical protein